MALGPCCTDLMKRRVELVEGWSRHVAFLLDLLYKLGALTEEDVDSVRGGGCRGERERMRRLLDVLHGRGEEACRAFQHALQQVSADPQPPPTTELPPPLPSPSPPLTLTDPLSHVQTVTCPPLSFIRLC
uniref:CARD domain-containing protein n=1 Tax=Paramormyrops kingsleyae TaxID=1676925 RepID=A0A3B3QB81_9TELE